jgi:hypothetical protein
MKKSILFSIMLFFTHSCFSQGFELFFGDEVDNFGYYLMEVPGEQTYLAITGGIGFKYLTTKIDKYGNVLWARDIAFEDNQSIYVQNILQEGDGFWIVSMSLNNDSYDKLLLTKRKYDFETNLIDEHSYLHDFGDFNPAFPNTQILLPDFSTITWIDKFGDESHVLMKNDSLGNLEWLRTFSSNSVNGINALDMISMPNGEIYLTGSALVNPNENTYHAFLLKFSQSGNLLWKTEIPQSTFFETYIKPYPDNNAVLIYGESDVTTGFGTFIGAVGTDGQLLWSQDFTPQAGFIEKKGVIPGENNTFYITGSRYGNNTNVQFLLQLDIAGNILWDKTYADFNLNNAGQLLRDHDNGFLIAAETYPFAAQGFSSDPYVIKTDSLGNKIWSWYKANDDYYLHQDALITSDAHYLILGASQQSLDTDYQAYMIKLSPNGTAYANVINGNVFFDQNSSCLKDTTEQGLGGWKIRSKALQTTFGITDSLGNYSINCNGDSTELTVFPPNEFWEPCTEIQTLQINSDSTEVNIAAKALQDCPALDIHLSTPFLRRCLNNSYYVNVCNMGTAAAIGTTLTVKLDSFFIFSNATPTPQWQNGQYLNFNIGDLGIGDCRQIKINFEISCEAELGQLHCIEAVSEPQNFCGSISSVHDRECQINIGSFDPNDKRAFSGSMITENSIPPDSLIEYQIRFQNTGTDTAFLVNILDTLSENLDLTTLQPTIASHPYKWSLEKSNILHITFEHILLPDSNINEAASHGFFNFVVRPKLGLPHGKVIPNTAAIYFDFNSPVFTNKLELSIDKSISTHALQPNFMDIQIFPVPASNRLWIDGGQHTEKINKILIINQLGMILSKQEFGQIATSFLEVDLKGIPNGQYFVQIMGEMMQPIVKKLVVQ